MSEVMIDIELLTCPICSDTFRDACDTSCGHTFCEFCLNACLESKPDVCPVCAKDPSPVHPAFTIRSICDMIAPVTPEDKDDESTLETEKEQGNASYYKNKFADAIVHYNNAIDKVTNSSDTKNCVLFNNRAQCYIHLRQYKRALMDCDEAIRLSNTNVKAYMRKGLCLRQLGQFVESRTAYMKAMELDTQQQWTQHIQEGLAGLPVFKASTTSTTSSQQQHHQPQQQQHHQQQYNTLPHQRPNSSYPGQPQTQQQMYFQQFQQQQQQQFNGGNNNNNHQYPSFNQNAARYTAPTGYPGQFVRNSTGYNTYHPQQSRNSQPPQQPPTTTTSTSSSTSSNVNNAAPSNNRPPSSTSTTSTSTASSSASSIPAPSAPPVSTSPSSAPISSSPTNSAQAEKKNCKSQ
ncbi:hypothetical protein SAMD00019534_019830 [Acytostelium subglobosum LB1]|uniref:hypothetical protein n=1 Tax=Acytostelium subglobosum LB1 TaxID=1410327 RepID=UPI000644D3DB|nr:hypothetical protein SAMD00019534_019830 [Acytostelium subglobosum LB1]GAM18808.1 hypothetical protein SAMD00019534_019830 [Acytostelium subglobosum LB1]|eukprot:XP_012758028.1 hypothetical protein SAMD00019534_019830 [Acytostelium subglobosum LB1]